MHPVSGLICQVAVLEGQKRIAARRRALSPFKHEAKRGREFFNVTEAVKIGIIGLGYVGLPLAVEFGKKFQTVGFDLKESRIDALRAGDDATGEVDTDGLAGGESAELSPAIPPT